MDRGAWWATVHGVAKSRTRLSDFTFTSLIKKLQPRSKFLGRINNKLKSSKDTDVEEQVEA